MSRKATSGAFSEFWEIVKTLLWAAVIAIVIRTFAYEPFNIPSGSMVPTLLEGDYLFVSKMAYGYSKFSFPGGLIPVKGRIWEGAPTRGEVVVFRDPQDLSTYFIKRIIGLPGETVAVADNTVTVVNKDHPSGFKLNETYLPAGLITAGNETYAISSSSYLVFGDNRPFSFDSRSWGPLPAKNMIGLVRVRLWPLNEITAFAAPNY